jgi:hypothetical protein
VCSLRAEDLRKEHEGERPSADVKTHVCNGAGALGKRISDGTHWRSQATWSRSPVVLLPMAQKNPASRSTNTLLAFEAMQTVAEIEARVRSEIRFSLVRSPSK